MHTCYKIFTPLGYRVLLARKKRLGPKLEGGCDRERPKNLGRPTHFCNRWSYLVHNLGLGLAYQKTTFRTKIVGGLGQGSIQKNCGIPYLFMQPLKLATSNLVYNLGLGLSYQKTTFRTKIGGGLGQGSIRKKLGPPIYLFISSTVEASDWKIGTQHEFRFTLPNTSFRTKLGRVWVKRVPLPSPLWWWWCNCVFSVPSKTDGYPD